MRVITISIIVLVSGLTSASAQIYLSPQIGFKVYGLSGATTENAGGQVSQAGISNGGGTVFNVGAGLGYELKFGLLLLYLGFELHLFEIELRKLERKLRLL